jgi:hypothetical protein
VEIEELIEEVLHESEDEESPQPPKSVTASFQSIQLSPPLSPEVDQDQEQAVPALEESKASSKKSSKSRASTANTSGISSVPDGEDGTVGHRSSLSARGDKSSLISDESLVNESMMSRRSSRSNKTATNKSSTTEVPPSSIKKIPERNSLAPASAIGDHNRRVSFGPDKSIPFSPAGSSVNTFEQTNNNDVSMLTLSSMGASPKSNKSFSSKSLESVSKFKSTDSPQTTNSLLQKSIEVPPAPPASVASKATTIASKKTTTTTPEKSMESRASAASKKSTVTTPDETSKSLDKSIITQGSKKSTRTASTSKKSVVSSSMEEEEAEEEEEPEEHEETQTPAKSTVSSSRASSVSKSHVSSASKSSSKATVKTPTPSKSSIMSATAAEEDDEQQDDQSTPMMDFPPPDHQEDDYFGADDAISSSARSSINKSKNRGSISRILNDSEMPSPNLSIHGSAAKLHTPSVASAKKSTPSRSSAKASTPGSVYTEAISTPGSKEFVRGRALPDESFHDASLFPGGSEDDDDDIETDKEEMDTTLLSRDAAATQQQKGGKSVKAKKGEGNEAGADLSTSFISKSFLKTISPSNEKYAGAKILQETKQKKKDEKMKEKEKKRKYKSQIFDSEEDDISGREMESEYEEEEDEEDSGLRRSRRATKGRRFAFWKGERPIYQEDTLVGVTEADPTPKKRVRNISNNNNNNNKRKRSGATTQESDSDDNNLRLAGDHDKLKKMRKEVEEKPLPPVDLPKTYHYQNQNNLKKVEIWDLDSEVISSIDGSQIVSFTNNRNPSIPMPRTAKRPPGKNGVGQVTHYFNHPERYGLYPATHVGALNLPAQAIKDPESVGLMMQFFFVADCQPNSLEFGLANPDRSEWDDKDAQRFVLNPGDSFYVPPNNIYRLENHSKAKEAKLTWVAVKALEEIYDPQQMEMMSNGNSAATYATSRR